MSKRAKVERLDERIVVRFTKQQVELIEGECQNSYLDKSSWIRQLILRALNVKPK